MHIAGHTPGSICEPASLTLARTTTVRTKGNTMTNITHIKNFARTDARTAAHADASPVLRTPYHSLGAPDAMCVPEWAEQRSVYRSAGRTFYVVDTASFADARADLKTLDRAGWDVQVAKDPAGSGARIAFSRRELAHAA